MEVIQQQYKETKIGLIPVEWECVSIKDVAKTSSGGTPSRDVPEYFGGNIPWIKTGELNNKYLYDSEEKITEQAINNSSAKLYPVNSLLIAMYGATIGKMSISKIPLSSNQACCAVYEDKTFSIEYLYYTISLRKNELISKGVGGAQPNISQKLISLLKLPLPPLPEQKKIASILSTIDEQIATTTAIIQQTQLLKKGLMQQLFTKGIGHTAFKQTKIGDIPESWEVVRLEEKSGFITKGATPTTYGYNWVEKGVPFLRSECVGKNGFTESGMMYISEEAHSKMKRSQIFQNDILMTITGNVGRVVKYPFEEGNINQHIAIVRITDKSTVSDFVLHQLSQEKYIKNYSRIITGAAYPQISLKQVRETLIALPSIEEQQKINTILTEVDSRIQEEKTHKTKLEQLKKGLMQVLLTGQVRVKL